MEEWFFPERNFFRQQCIRPHIIIKKEIEFISGKSSVWNPRSQKRRSRSTCFSIIVTSLLNHCYSDLSLTQTTEGEDNEHQNHHSMKTKRQAKSQESCFGFQTLYSEGDKTCVTSCETEEEEEEVKEQTGEWNRNIIIIIIILSSYWRKKYNIFWQWQRTHPSSSSSLKFHPWNNCCLLFVDLDPKLKDVTQDEKEDTKFLLVTNIFNHLRHLLHLFLCRIMNWNFVTFGKSCVWH